MPLRKTRYRREPLTEVNITNLIDIIMVLLVVFILISNFVQTGLNIDLPQATYTERSGKQSIVIGISAPGTVTVNGETVSEDQLPAVMQSLYEEKPGERVYIHSDGLALVEQLVSVMAIAKEAGFIQVGIAADEKSNGA